MTLLDGLGGRGGKLLGVIASICREERSGESSMGVKGSFKNMETSRRSLAGVLSLIGSRAMIRRPKDDLGFSTISEVEGAKRPL